MNDAQDIAIKHTNPLIILKKNKIVELMRYVNLMSLKLSGLGHRNLGAR